MKNTTFRTHLLIHLFAVAHALVVVCFATLGWRDEIPLTFLTILMIIMVARGYGFPLDLSAVMALLFCFAGFFMGTKGGELLQPLTSVYGHALSNVICTFLTTEVLGWSTWLIATKTKRNNNVGKTAK
ncbi:MAG: hypothetical protein NC038_06000 [Paludibacter sp.]|nr:hypothetical protein [Bacteroidales bacterium]MCM1069297.1 hypothetical protein [Prevotella sp.]MCM1353720.1 hypothetical protein [Bacteroides sp.]MCM1442212.1 hypothetical protein [Muribaculum sp.]MCM1482174.1 hypothetical protein [Paludibacter sp.]